MQPEDLRLRDFLSNARHSKYLLAARGDAAQAARLFVWNCQLSAAYWPAIALAEMAVRNAINTHLCSYLGVPESTGWHVDALSDKPRIHLLEKDRDKLESSIATFRRRRDTDPVEPSGDDVVGGTSLGLWVALCGEGRPRHHTYDYHRRIWRGMKLWQAFSGYEAWLTRTGHRKTPADNPGPLRGVLRDFELIRNRIAHHEPIYALNHGHHRKNIADLAEMIDSDLRRYVEHTDAVAPILAQYSPFVLGVSPPSAASAPGTASADDTS